MHLDQSWLDGIVTGDIGNERRVTAEAHLAGCDECRERLEDRRLSELLEYLDDPAPYVDRRRLMAMGEQRRSPALMRWAAGVLLALGTAGAVYAAPGSPVPAWIGSLTGGAGSASEAPGSVPHGDDSAGIAVPVGDRLAIELRPQAGGTIRLVLDDVADVTVEALDGWARFDSRTERLVVQGDAAPDFRITLPRGAPWIEVLVGATSVFRLASGEVVSIARADGPGRYSVAFSDVR